MDYYIHLFLNVLYTRPPEKAKQVLTLTTTPANIHYFYILPLGPDPDFEPPAPALCLVHVCLLNTLFSSCQFNCSLSGAEQRITSLANDVCCCNTLINILHVIILCPLPQQIKL